MARGMHGMVVGLLYRVRHIGAFSWLRASERYLLGAMLYEARTSVHTVALQSNEYLCNLRGRRGRAYGDVRTI